MAAFVPGLYTLPSAAGQPNVATNHVVYAASEEGRIGNSLRNVQHREGWTRQKMSEEWWKFSESQWLGDKDSAYPVPNSNLHKVNILF